MTNPKIKTRALHIAPTNLGYIQSFPYAAELDHRSTHHAALHGIFTMPSNDSHLNCRRKLKLSSE